jgi:hypothetical protein
VRHYYLFLPGGYPEWIDSDDHERFDELRRHPLIGIYNDLRAVIMADDQAEREARERIRRNGRPNLASADVRRLLTLH